MDKKIVLGIPLFFTNATNSGVVNYIFNIISALNTLPDEQKPEIVLLYSADAPVEYIKRIGYPYITYKLFNRIDFGKLGRIPYKILNKLRLKEWLNKQRLSKIDVLYPYFEFIDDQLSSIKHKIHWLVDFNNMAFPEHYSDGARHMNDFQKDLFSRTERIALSSNTLLDELKHYYPNYRNKVSILRFACTLPDISNIDTAKLKEKYGITGKYVMSPNQFWEHKNQITLIEALRLLKEQGKLNFTVVFTGSMAVNRGKGHMLEKLLALVKAYGIEEHIKFLGIIDRLDQLALMRDCTALIQPSLYEGWSTLVEEAKALNQNIVLSNLPVHIEQNCVNSYFFDPHNPVELASRIEEVMNKGDQKNKIDYQENVRKFGEDLISMINQYRS